MTQEEKDLLLKDILARVQYGIKVNYHGDIFTLGYNLYLNNSYVAFENYPMQYFLEKIESVKPYLRPLTSMTEEEKKELFQLMGNGTDINRIDFYLSHHFDCRCLIGKGLALEAPEDMYKC